MYKNWILRPFTALFTNILFKTGLEWPLEVPKFEFEKKTTSLFMASSPIRKVFFLRTVPNVAWKNQNNFLSIPKWFYERDSKREGRMIRFLFLSWRTWYLRIFCRDSRNILRWRDVSLIRYGDYVCSKNLIMQLLAPMKIVPSIKRLLTLI